MWCYARSLFVCVWAWNRYRKRLRRWSSLSPHLEMSLTPKESAKFIAEHADHVKINKEAIPAVAEKVCYSKLFFFHVTTRFSFSSITIWKAGSLVLRGTHMSCTQRLLDRQLLTGKFTPPPVCSLRLCSLALVYDSCSSIKGLFSKETSHGVIGLPCIAHNSKRRHDLRSLSNSISF